MHFSRVKFYAPNKNTLPLRDKHYGGNHLPKLYPNISDPYAQYIRKSQLDDFVKYSTSVERNSEGLAKPTLSFDDISGSIPYNDADNNDPNNYNGFNKFLRSEKGIHQGQRKLLLCELQALAATFPDPMEHGIVIYTGSAPSSKIRLAMELYPNILFIFVDPNEHFIYENGYDIPHYVVLDETYIADGSKWGGPTDREERKEQSQKYVYLSVSRSDMYESRIYKKKNVDYYDPNRAELVRMHKPFTNSGYNNSARRINQHSGEFPLMTARANQRSIDFVYDCAVKLINGEHCPHRAFIIEEYFTNDLAKMIGKANKKHSNMKITFWSDIRTNVNVTNRDTGISPSDLDILLNTAWMYSWSRLMNLPPKSTMMVKFRTPFFNESTEIDFSQFEESFNMAAELGYDFRIPTWKNNKFVFFPGKIMLQAWCGPNSAESRLIVRSEDIISNNLYEYDMKNYEERFAFYNGVDRYSICHENSNADRDIGFCHCNDCAIENSILCEYSKHNPLFNVKDYLLKVEKYLNIKLLLRAGKAGHGYVFTDLTMDGLNHIVSNYVYQ